MNLAVASQELSQAFEPIRQPDWAGLLVADDVRGLQKKVDQFEIDTSTWRANMAMRIRASFDMLKANVTALPEAEAYKIVQGAVAPAIGALNEAIHSHESPLHSDPRVSLLLETIASNSPTTAKTLRKILRRIERLRVDRYNACVDMYYALLTFETEFDPDAKSGTVFTSGAEAANHLRKLIA